MNNFLNRQITYQTAYHKKNAFALFVRQNTSSANIRMMLFRDPLNTAHIPYTYDVLKNYLPSVLTTQCFNDENLPFHQEVKRTEIGHLYEHILLEYLCQLKISKGSRSAVYEGRTRWNWKKDPRGLFHIHINCTQKDADILPAAISNSNDLMQLILNRNSKQAPNYSLISQYDTQFGNAVYNKMLKNTIPYQLSWNSGLKNGRKTKSPRK